MYIVKFTDVHLATQLELRLILVGYSLDLDSFALIFKVASKHTSLRQRVGSFSVHQNFVVV